MSSYISDENDNLVYEGIYTVANTKMYATKQNEIDINENAAWDTIFNQHDAETPAGAYEKNARLLPSAHEVVSGSAEIEKSLAGVVGSGVSNHHLELVDSGSNGPLMWTAARWSAETKSTDGSVKKVEDFATRVFERQGKQLKLRMHSFN